jgi:Cu-Zn family superoxide dismutase
MKKLIAATAAAALAAGCQSVPPEPMLATAALQPTKGSKAFGEATFEQAGDKVHLLVNAQGLRSNQQHGLQIQEAGDCSSGDGMSAKGRRAGDLPALKADKDGRARLDAEVAGITLAAGPGGIVGRSLVIQAVADGVRLACGVIRAS